MINRLMDTCRRKISSVRIVSSLIVFNLFIAILPVLVIGFLFNGQIERSIRSEQSLIYEKEVGKYVSSLNSRLTEYMKMAGRIANDAQVCSFLSRRGGMPLAEQYREAAGLQSIIGAQLVEETNTEFHDVNLFMRDSWPEVYASHVSNVHAAMREGWYDRYAAMSPGEDGFFYQPSAVTGKCFAIIKSVYDNADAANYGVPLGFVKLDLVLGDLFYAPSWSIDRDSLSVLITADHSETLYQTENGGNSFSGLRQRIDGIGASEGMDYLDGHRLLIHKVIDRTGWDVYFIIDDSSTLNKIGEVRLAFIMLGVALVLLSLLLSAAFSHNFSARISRLVRKMQKVKDGNLDIPDMIEGNDEVAQIDRYFNDMVRMLRKLIEDNYIQVLSTREAELNALKFQINPHFLFNTLETINAMSAEFGAGPINVICQNLGNMFRYNINVSGGDLELFDNELGHAKNYIDIQKIRFDDRFRVVYDIAPQLLHCRVIRFILQPILENAFRHGVEKKEGECTITVGAQRDGGKLIIRISDDGPGIAPERVREMNALFATDYNDPFSPNETGGIGMKNVNLRIRIKNGAGYGLRVSSKLNAGTTVFIILPYYNDL